MKRMRLGQRRGSFLDTQHINRNKDNQIQLDKYQIICIFLLPSCISLLILFYKNSNLFNYF